MRELLRDLGRLFTKSAARTFKPFQSWSGFSFFAVTVYVITLGRLWVKADSQGMKLEVDDLIKALPPVLWALLAFFVWNLLKASIETYQKQKALISSQAEQLRQRQDEIDGLKQGAQLVRILRSYRVARNSPTNILLTALDGSSVTGAFTQAFADAGIGRIEFHLLDILPSARESEASKGIKDGHLVVHAKDHADGVDELVRNVNGVVQTERSYLLPTDQHGDAIDVVWFQLGKNLKWRKHF